jgi:small subunit ribosomal protein S7e
LALDRVEEAIDCCARCLAFDPNNSGTKSVHAKALKAKQDKEALERARQERIRQEGKDREILATAYQVCSFIQVEGPRIYEM